jgi:cytochrome c oxidase subunit 2
MRRVVIVVLLGVVGGVVLALGFSLIPWFPTDAASQATRTDRLFWAITYVSFVIFGVVTAIMLYAVWKFRRRDEHDMRDGTPTHGSTGLEIFWTAIPAAIVIFFSIWAAIDLRDNESFAKGDRVVTAIAKRYAWSFRYDSDGGFTSGILELPIGQTVEIQTEAPPDGQPGVAVIHSFFVPAWRVKADAVPGQGNRTFATPNRIGQYDVICADLCGPGHSGMRTNNGVHVVTQAEFDTWLSQQKQGGTQ